MVYTMTPEIIHSLVLMATITAAYLSSKTILATYDLQIAAVLFMIFFIAKKFLGSGNKSRLIESVIFTFLVLFIVGSTGGLASPYFFLLYFLLFSLSLLLEPIISITATLALIIFFILELPPAQPFQTLFPLFSLAFLTPFALFMGQEYIESQKFRLKADRLIGEKAKSQEETFLFLSLMLRNHLRSIRHHIDNFMGDNELQNIKKHVRNMEHLIDKFEKQ